jgi:hypothetical protein
MHQPECLEQTNQQGKDQKSEHQVQATSRGILLVERIVCACCVCACVCVCVRVCVPSPSIDVQCVSIVAAVCVCVCVCVRVRVLHKHAFTHKSTHAHCCWISSGFRSHWI